MIPAPPDPLPAYPTFVFHEPTATVEHASELSGVSVRKIQELMANGSVQFMRVGKANLVVMSTFSDWLRAEYHRNPNPRDVRLTQLRGIGAR